MKHLLQGIGIIFTLIASFLGLMYCLRGDILISSLVSLIIIVIEYFLIEKFIQSKSEITKNRLSPMSIILWSIYFVLAIPISIFLFHALNVEINAKKDIQAIANKKIADLNDMVTDFNSKVDKGITTLSIGLDVKLTQYAARSSSALALELKSPPFNLDDAEVGTLKQGNVKQVVNAFIAAKSLKFQLVADSVKTANQNFINRYGGVFDGWSRLHLNYAFYELDNLLDKNKRTLSAVYDTNMPDSLGKFAYDYSIEETNMDKPLELFNKYKPYYLILIVLIFHVLILLPYFIEPVSGVYLRKKGPRKGGGLEI